MFDLEEFRANLRLDGATLEPRTIPIIYTPPTGEDRHAALVFRVGRAHETVRLGGITHLVEHMASPPSQAYQHNAYVGPDHTVFGVGGTEDQVIDHLRHVVEAMAELPEERFEPELRILKIETKDFRTGPEATLLSMRFGAVGFGLLNYPQFGLRSIRYEQAREWAQTRFVGTNCVLWTDSERVMSMAFELPAGGPAGDPPGESLGLDYPVRATGAGAWIGGAMLVQRSAAARASLAVLTRRLYGELRLKHGYSYKIVPGYLPLASSVAHLTIWADTSPEHADEAAVAYRRILSEVGDTCEADEVAASLPKEGPKPEPANLAMTAAHLLLQRRQYKAWDELNQENRAVTETTVSSTIREALESLVWVAGAAGEASAPDNAWTNSSKVPPVDGQRLNRFVFTNDRLAKATLVVGDQGVSRLHPSGDLTVRFDQCAAGLWWHNGHRTLIGNDGTVLEIVPRSWESGVNVVKMLNLALDKNLWIPMEDGPPVSNLLPRPTAGSRKKPESDEPVVREAGNPRETAILITAGLVALLGPLLILVGIQIAGIDRGSAYWTGGFGVVMLVGGGSAVGRVLRSRLRRRRQRKAIEQAGQTVA